MRAALVLTNRELRFGLLRPGSFRRDGASVVDISLEAVAPEPREEGALRGSLLFEAPWV